MRHLIKAAVIALGATGALAAAEPASAQPYDDGYYDDDYGPGYDDGYGAPYSDGYYDQAYGYGCDEYGCPDDYYDMPYYDGEVYYDGAWLGGPFFYRDFGGRRQYWIHGGWRYGQYRGGNFRPARGRAWYDQHRSFAGGGYRGGYAGRGNYGGGGYRNYGNYRDYNQRYNGAGTSRFNYSAPQAQAFQPQGRGGDHNWGGRSDWSNRQGFQPQQQQSFGGGDRVTRGNFWRQNAPAMQQAQPQAQQSQPQRSFGGRGDWGGRGGDRSGDRGGDHGGGFGGDHGGRRNQ